MWARIPRGRSTQGVSGQWRRLMALRLMALSYAASNPSRERLDESGYHAHGNLCSVPEGSRGRSARESTVSRGNPPPALVPPECGRLPIAIHDVLWLG